MLIFTEWKFKAATLIYMTIIFMVFVAAPAYLLSTPIASHTEQIRFLAAYNIQLDIVIFILFLWFGSIPVVYWGTVIRWQQHRNYILAEAEVAEQFHNPPAVISDPPVSQKRRLRRR